MIANYSKIALLTGFIGLAFLLASCDSEESLNELVASLDATADQSDDNDDNGQNDEPVNPFADIIPSSAIATVIINDDLTVPNQHADSLPGINNPDDIAADLAEFNLESGIAYDPSTNQLYVFGVFNLLVYKIDLDLDVVSWFAGSGAQSPDDVFDTAGSADPVLPRDLALEPRDIALSGDYLYIANFGSIIKLPTDGSSVSRAELQFASGSLTNPDPPDRDSNLIPQTKGLLAPENINVGRIKALSAHEGYIYVSDERNKTLRLISTELEGGLRQVFNYYWTDPMNQNYEFGGATVDGDDGQIYVMSWDYYPVSDRRLLKLPPFSGLSDYDYAVDFNDNWFSGGSGTNINEGSDGDATTAIFGYSFNVVSANSLIYVPETGLRVISDNGTVTTVPLVAGDPSPYSSGGSSIYFAGIIYAGDNLFYATTDHTVLEISLQFE